MYRAYDPVLDREVALKVPHPGSLQTPKMVERFLREAKAAAQLRHPNIVPLYDAGRDGDLPYIASAFIDGRPLSEVIDDGLVDLKQAAEITLGLAEALHYAHGLGIVHRDVKPANVMLDADGRAILMDFGLARFELSEEKLTKEGAVMGTPAYMPPEQARGDSSAIGPASDQYSLGATLYELLTGHTPFSGPSEIVLFNVLRQEPPRPRQDRPEVSLDLETICLKAMAKEPPARFADCGALADDLAAGSTASRSTRGGSARPNGSSAGAAANRPSPEWWGWWSSSCWWQLRCRCIGPARRAIGLQRRSPASDVRSPARGEQSRMNASPRRGPRELRAIVARADEERRRADRKAADALARAEELRREKEKVETLRYLPLVNLAAEALARGDHVGRSAMADRGEAGQRDRRAGSARLGVVLSRSTVSLPADPHRQPRLGGQPLLRQIQPPQPRWDSPGEGRPGWFFPRPGSDDRPSDPAGFNDRPSDPGYEGAGELRPGHGVQPGRQPAGPTRER